MPVKRNTLPPNPEKTGGRFPSWLHRKLPQGASACQTGDLIADLGLHTVCEEAKCPNRMECWAKKTATVLIMGKECTRNCAFCDIAFNSCPAPLDEEEGEKVAQLVKRLGLKHLVITQVTRDDLPDGGAAHMAAVIEAVRQVNPTTTIEVLTSDFSGNKESLDTIFAAKPEIFNYNIETTESLTPKLRHKATYARSLEVLQYAKSHSSNILVKSGIMVGLGETDDEVKATIADLERAGCDIITIGQYLQPSGTKVRVKAFITPEQFKLYEAFGYELGVKMMHCGPFVRSSYNAELVIPK